MTSHVRSSGAATGRPLIALVGLVVCWTGARVAIADWSQPSVAIERPSARRAPIPAVLPQASPQVTVRREGPNVLSRLRGAPVSRVRLGEVPQVRVVPAHVSRFAPASHSPRLAEIVVSQSTANASAPSESAPSMGGAAPLPQTRPETDRRWSADLWVALREGAGQFIGTVAVPVYGGSQAGAVLRYRLAPASSHEPGAYVRAVHALGREEGDVAAGLAARLSSKLPLVAHVEARASRRGEQVHLRPAAFLTAGFEDGRLPLDILARGYAQAGYVGGPEATGFADGNLIAERPLASVGRSTLSAGAGLWGGAQRDSTRLDIGPSASVRLPLGGGSARLILDYRHRIAGNAAPASGVTLTLSAGF